MDGNDYGENSVTEVQTQPQQRGWVETQELLKEKREAEISGKWQNFVKTKKKKKEKKTTALTRLC